MELELKLTIAMRMCCCYGEIIGMVAMLCMAQRALRLADTAVWGHT